jgi:hypothetical protein
MRIKVRLNKDVKVTIIGADSTETKQLLRDLGVIVTCQGCQDGKDPPGPGFNPFDGVAEIECPVCQLSAADRAGRARDKAGADMIAGFEKLYPPTPGVQELPGEPVGVGGSWHPTWWDKAKETPPICFDAKHPTGDLFDGDSWTAEPESDREKLDREARALGYGAASDHATSGSSPSAEEAKQEVNPPGHLRGRAEIEEDIAAAGKKSFADLPLAAKLEVENQLRTEGIIQANPPTPQATSFDGLADQVQRAQGLGNQLAYRQFTNQGIVQATQLAQGEVKTEPKPSSPSEPAIEPPAKAEAPSSASPKKRGPVPGIPRPREPEPNPGLKVPAGVIVFCKGNRWTWRCTVPAWVGSSTQKWPTRDAARQDAIRWLESDPPLADKSGSYDPDVFDRTRERKRWPYGFRVYFAMGKWHWECLDGQTSDPFATYREALDSLLSLHSVDPATDIPEPAPVEPPPPMAAMLPDAKAKEETALVAPKEAFYIHPGAGWGPFEGGGLVKHLVCNGKGCTGCSRQGYKRCLEKPKRAFKVF